MLMPLCEREKIWKSCHRHAPGGKSEKVIENFLPPSASGIEIARVF